jgi:pimeloyl-ACP methyl ester carboxylesterase
MAAFLCPPGYAGPRGLRAIAREGSAVTEAARFVGRSTRDRLARRDTPYATRSPQPGQAPVVLVPGFMAGDGSLGLMARHLRRIGNRTYRSTMHANVGCTQDASDSLERRIEAIALKRDRKVTIVGHSLGGLLARGVAARRPDLVDQIVTLGSPLLAPGAAHQLLLLDLALLVRLQRLGLGRVMGADCTSGDCARLSWEQATAPLHKAVGFTSVFSRRASPRPARSGRCRAALARRPAPTPRGAAARRPRRSSSPRRRRRRPGRRRARRAAARAGRSGRR